MIKNAMLPAFFGILFYKIIELPMHNYPYIAEIFGAIGGSIMFWTCNLASDFLNRKKARNQY
ncbi:hypothetical protein GCM10007870_25400 [Gluconobacter kondonii]|uniref:Uncharacterized protein n=1 Tax=Gluconobacter kondonii TaxID=941463 RepID=A0ABQ5WV91_9PROT|nr:hypothetical protein GCM10007870_25400 [Gluconobacter kondonii]